jgi:hypothetical protein
MVFSDAVAGLALEEI